MDKLVYNNPENHNYPNNNNNNNSSYPVYADASLPEFTFFLIIFVSCTTSFYRLWCFYLRKCIDSRKIKKRQNLLKPRTVTSNDEVNLLNECTICLEKYIKKEKIIELPCKHNFHAKCIKEWFEKDNKSCHNCRENII